ncbi:MAG: hypothetical protein AAF772_17920, partial [Acidobacteriota bacterium]
MHVSIHRAPARGAHRLTSCYMQGLALFAALLTIAPGFGAPLAAQDVPVNRVSHYGQPVFVTGANLAYIVFEADIGPSYGGSTQFTIGNPNVPAG